MKKKVLTLRETVVFAMLGAIMFATKKAMEGLPNIHLIGIFLVAITLVFRAKALFPLYIYVLIDGLFLGFNLAWVPYLYVWTVLWGAVMLVPKKLKPNIKKIICIALCGLHGFLFGTLYAPFQALAYGFDFRTTVLWIIGGLEFDIIHGISNICLGVLIFPLEAVLRREYNRMAKKG